MHVRVKLFFVYFMTHSLIYVGVDYKVPCPPGVRCIRSYPWSGAIKGAAAPGGATTYHVLPEVTHMSWADYQRKFLQPAAASPGTPYTPGFYPAIHSPSPAPPSPFLPSPFLQGPFLQSPVLPSPVLQSPVAASPPAVPSPPLSPSTVNAKHKAVHSHRFAPMHEKGMVQYKVTSHGGTRFHNYVHKPPHYNPATSFMHLRDMYRDSHGEWHRHYEVIDRDNPQAASGHSYDAQELRNHLRNAPHKTGIVFRPGTVVSHVRMPDKAHVFLHRHPDVKNMKNAVEVHLASYYDPSGSGNAVHHHALVSKNVAQRHKMEIIQKPKEQQRKEQQRKAKVGDAVWFRQKKGATMQAAVIEKIDDKNGLPYTIILKGTQTTKQAHPSTLFWDKEATRSLVWKGKGQGTQQTGGKQQGKQGKQQGKPQQTSGKQQNKQQAKKPNVKAGEFHMPDLFDESPRPPASPEKHLGAAGSHVAYELQNTKHGEGTVLARIKEHLSDGKVKIHFQTRGADDKHHEHTMEVDAGHLKPLHAVGDSGGHFGKISKIVQTEQKRMVNGTPRVVHGIMYKTHDKVRGGMALANAAQCKDAKKLSSCKKAVCVHTERGHEWHCEDNRLNANQCDSSRKARCNDGSEPACIQTGGIYGRKEWQCDKGIPMNAMHRHYKPMVSARSAVHHETPHAETASTSPNSDSSHVKEGELYYHHDPRTGEIRAVTVVRLFTNQNTKVKMALIKNGSSEGKVAVSTLYKTKPTKACTGAVCDSELLGGVMHDEQFYSKPRQLMQMLLKGKDALFGRGLFGLRSTPNSPPTYTQEDLKELMKGHKNLINTMAKVGNDAFVIMYVPLTVGTNKNPRLSSQLKKLHDSLKRDGHDVHVVETRSEETAVKYSIGKGGKVLREIKLKGDMVSDETLLHVIKETLKQGKNKKN